MVDPDKNRLQSMLRIAVQSVQWTYSLFWKLCPEQGILIWSDGYYNGAIKTRKTVQPTEVSTEEASLHRSQQLRELYESLSSGDPNNQARRPSASLSPEDLTEAEWFYLMCVSFSFPPGIGLPGKAYAKRQYVWLTGANEIDSKVFSRAILAKSARIQTVVCIPLLDGVVEFGTTERVEEDVGLVQGMGSFFKEVQNNPPPPQLLNITTTSPQIIRPALSEHSTSNPPLPPTVPSGPFQSPATLLTDTPVRPPTENSHVEGEEHIYIEEEDDEEDENEEEDDEEESESETRGKPNDQIVIMQMDMSEDIRIGSPDDGSNHLDSSFHILPVGRTPRPSDHHGRRWRTPKAVDPMSSVHPRSGFAGVATPPSIDVQTQEEDAHYSQTVSAILEIQSHRWPINAASAPMHAAGSAFSKWPTSASCRSRNLLHDGSSQWVLKYILLTVPYLHSSKPRSRGSHPQDELSANHVLAERRRREKLNERFIILRNLVPFVTKMDKASILADTIEYVKQLRRKIQELECGGREMEAEMGSEKRKLRIVEGGGGKPKTAAVAVQVDVSIIESDVLVEIECMQKEGLLLDVMQILRKFRIEVRVVQSSTTAAGVFTAELRAKVKEGCQKPSIVDVKRSINHIIIHH